MECTKNFGSKMGDFSEIKKGERRKYGLPRIPEDNILESDPVYEWFFSTHHCLLDKRFTQSTWQSDRLNVDLYFVENMRIM